VSAVTADVKSVGFTPVELEALVHTLAAAHTRAEAWAWEVIGEGLDAYTGPARLRDGLYTALMEARAMGHAAARAESLTSDY
jgi:hypothetical protein